MSFKKYFLIFGLIGIMFAGCSDDDDNNTNSPNTNTDNYFPMVYGSNWYTHEIIINTDSTMDESQYTVDSMTVTGSGTWMDKTYQIITQYNYEGQEIHTPYWRYTENEQLYAPAEEINAMLSTSMDNAGFFIEQVLLDDQWIKIADVNSSAWTLNEVELVDEPIKFQDMDLTLNATFSMTIKASANEIVTVDGVDYDCLVFTTTTSLDGTVSLSLIQAPAKLTIYQHDYYAKNVGWIKSVTEPYNIKVENDYFPIDETVPGSYRIARKMNITQLKDL